MSEKLHAKIEGGKVIGWSQEPESPEAFAARLEQAKAEIVQEWRDDLAELERQEADEIIETLVVLKPIR